MALAKEALAEYYELEKEELELLRQLCLPYKVIAKKMKLSKAAIGMRVFRLTQKLGVENREAVMVKAIQMGLVTPEQLVYRKFDRSS